MQLAISIAAGSAVGMSSSDTKSRIMHRSVAVSEWFSTVPQWTPECRTAWWMRWYSTMLAVQDCENIRFQRLQCCRIQCERQASDDCKETTVYSTNGRFDAVHQSKWSHRRDDTLVLRYKSRYRCADDPRHQWKYQRFFVRHNLTVRIAIDDWENEFLFSTYLPRHSPSVWYSSCAFSSLPMVSIKWNSIRLPGSCDR